MSKSRIFTRGLMVGSFLIGFLTYLLFELYCDVDESNLKTEMKHPNVEDVSKDKKRKKKSKSNSDRMTCEICLSDVTSAISAIDGGATSIELCTNRADGGITPFMGLVQEVVSLSRSKDVEIHVLIRPRAGNFVYSSVEFDVITRDIIAAKNAGADGIVIGILLENGVVDELRMAVVRSLSAGLTLTFHRAFDVTADPRGALESIVALGCDRLLTSAQSDTALDGIVQLKELVSLAAGRIQIIAASGIGAGNVFDIIVKSHVNGVHAGSSVHELLAPAPREKECEEEVPLPPSDIGTSEDASIISATAEKVVACKDWPPRQKLSGLSDSYESVSAARVLKLSDTVNTASLLLSLERGDSALGESLGLPGQCELGYQKAVGCEEKEEYGIISKATSADFSDDMSFEHSPPKICIETSYVHVDSESSSNKKWSWFRRG